MRKLLLLGLTAVFAFSCAGKTAEVKDDPMKTKEKVSLREKAPDIDKRVAKFVALPMKPDISFLTPNEKEVLRHLVEASKLIDEIYFRQVYSKNLEYKTALLGDKNLDRAFVEYFDINYGPFDRLEDDKPFIGGQKKPLGANFYPCCMTKEEFEKWIKDHPADAGSFRSLTTVIKRDGKNLIAVPYSKEYAQWLKPAEEHLKKAASLTENASLKKFLNSRAEAFLNDDYYQSDIDWMDIKDSPIEITIGPYEVYEDGLFGYKASYESFVTVINPEESKKLAIYQKYLKQLDRELPIPDELKSKREKYESPIRVAEVVYAAGDAKKGIQTIAFNLPNDEKVRMAKGNKQVMLKNLMDAKFKGILTKVAEEALDPEQLKLLSSEAFFLEILHHELGHSLGAGNIKLADGTETTVNKALKERYSTMEEAKADVLGIYNLLSLMDKGVVPRSLEKSLLPTYLAGIFRAIRFGMNDAHGQGMMIQFNYLTSKGVISYNDATKKFRVNFENFRPVFKDLVHDILMVEATGDYEKAGTMIASYGKAPESVKAAVARLSGIPVDIRPMYATKF